MKAALEELTSAGFVRYNSTGYRTLGPFAKLGQARTKQQFTKAWERLNAMQKISCSSLSSTSSNRSNTI